MTEHGFFVQCGYSQEQGIRLMDTHTMAVQAWLSSRAPGAATFQGEGIRASSTGLGVPLLNLALGYDYPPATDESAVVQDIEAVKAFFAERGVPWLWWIGPRPNRPAIEARLKRHGLVSERPGLPAMAATLTSERPPYPPSIITWEAETLEDLRAASHIRRVAFRFPQGQGQSYFENMPDSWLNNPQARLFLAGFSGDRPASIGALIYGAGLPGVYIMATLPDHGRRGLGKAILTRILDEAASGNPPFIVLTASRYGFPLYRQFGFQHIFDYKIYQPQP